MALERRFVASTRWDHVTTACLFCTEERPAEHIGPHALAWAQAVIAERGVAIRGQICG